MAIEIKFETANHNGKDVIYIHFERNLEMNQRVKKLVGVKCEVVQKNDTLFYIKNAENGSNKTKKSYTHYESDFKEEILRMRIVAQLNSGKMSIKFQRPLGLVEMSSADARYTWKNKSQMKTKIKTSEEQTTYSLKLVSENELLKKENLRLQSERDILKKALVLFSTSS